jgi:hypothetical protein
MTLQELITEDVKRHYPPETVVGEIFALFNNEIKGGSKVVRQGDSIIVYKPIAEGVIEHHSFNADSTKNLVDFHKKFWRMLAKAGIKMATTTYNNPKISDLINSVKNEFDVSITKDNDGRYVSQVRF